MTTPTTVNARFQLRADTAANWASVNPTLLTNELGLETDTKKLKVGDGSTAWNSLGYFPSIVSGGTVLGNLEIGTTGTLTFEGSTADGFETTLAVTDPTADRTITLPDQSGTVVVSGNASITDADIAANAEIAVSKLANGTANQVLVTDGTDVSWSDDLTLAGNLTVNGTTTTVNTETLTVKDKNIELAVVDTPTDTTADGGGITLKGSTDKTINWIDATDAWTSSERFSYPLGSAAAPALTFTGDENTGIYSPGADQVAISTNGTQRLLINANGTLSNSSATSLAASFAGTGSAYVDTTNGTGTFRVQLLSNTPTIGAATNHSLVFTTNNTERMRLSSTGALGLGTSSPDTNLEIALTGSSANGLLLSSDNADTSARLFFQNATAGEGYAILQENGGLDFRSGATAGTSSGTQRVRIDSSGRLGLGTSSADNKLSVGIASADEGIELKATYNGARVARFAILNPGVDNTPYIGSVSGNDFGFITSGTRKMTLTAGGSLGIGTSTVSDRLHVRGVAPKIRIDGGTDAGTYGVKLYGDTTEQVNFTYNNQTGVK